MAQAIWLLLLMSRFTWTVQDIFRWYVTTWFVMHPLAASVARLTYAFVFIIFLNLD